MDTYQPIYDAVRSRLGNTDVGEAIASAFREANIPHHVAMAAETVRGLVAEQGRPCVLFKPTVSLDGNQWCALYGDDLQKGVAGFGNSPEDAMQDFDRQWFSKLQPSNED